MWVEYLKIENVKCFEQISMRFCEGNQPYRWVTLLGENGGGKSTALQALGLLLAGPDGAQKLLPRPIGWVRNESHSGLISTRVHQGDSDPEQYGTDRITKAFGYSFFVTGKTEVSIRNRKYSDPAVVENADKNLGWLREHAFASTGRGWFAAGYGAFRRLTRSAQIIIPSLEPQARFANFTTQFNEDEPLSAFERWMVYLDYRISKGGENGEPKKQRDLGIRAIDQLLPEGVSFARVTEEGRVCFRVHGVEVPTVTLSDGYRSVLALAGDLVWRLILAFPDSPDPLKEEGVVLIDELDIHLHPLWQRNIASVLRGQFPNIQFIVATHSPLIAAGAGEDALTLKFELRDGQVAVRKVDNIAAMSVDRILQSEAFGLVSPFSPQTQEKINRYDALARKGKRTHKEDEDFQTLSLFVEEARPFGGPPKPDSLDDKIERYLKEDLK
jgi:predicted ATPase